MMAKNQEIDIGIDFWEHVSQVKWSFLGYYRAYNEYERLKRLVGKEDYNSQFQIRDITQNNYCFGPTVYMRSAKQKVEKYQKKCFEYLNTLQEPYGAIYRSIWFYNTHNGIFKEYREEGTGINDITHFIARKYALHSIYDTHTI